MPSVIFLSVLLSMDGQLLFSWTQDGCFISRHHFYIPSREKQREAGRGGYLYQKYKNFPNRSLHILCSNTAAGNLAIVFIWVCCYPEENQDSLVRKTE